MAGLLTSPRFYLPSHPDFTGQWRYYDKSVLFLRKKRGVTAAGPYRNFTGFPIMPEWGTIKLVTIQKWHFSTQPCVLALLQSST
jgi:hypothetical protein